MLALAVVIAFASSKSNANDIFIEQYGDSFEMSLIQKNGSNNYFDLYSNGDTFTYDVVQDGNDNDVILILSGNPTDVTINQTGDDFGIAINYTCTGESCSMSVTQY